MQFFRNSGPPKIDYFSFICTKYDPLIVRSATGWWMTAITFLLVEGGMKFVSKYMQIGQVILSCRLYLGSFLLDQGALSPDVRGFFELTTFLLLVWKFPKGNSGKASRSNLLNGFNRVL